MADLTPIPTGIPWDPWDPSLPHSHAHLYVVVVDHRLLSDVLSVCPTCLSTDMQVVTSCMFNNGKPMLRLLYLHVCRIIVIVRHELSRATTRKQRKGCICTRRRKKSLGPIYKISLKSLRHWSL